jgi:hypothetical protein
MLSVLISIVTIHSGSQRALRLHAKAYEPTLRTIGTRMTDPGNMIDGHKYRPICSKDPWVVLQKVVWAVVELALALRAQRKRLDSQSVGVERYKQRRNHEAVCLPCTTTVGVLRQTQTSLDKYLPERELRCANNALEENLQLLYGVTL